ncbi:type II secretion system protein [Candidatus Aerophobetes bacterium]|nr:type II secretion system protein [Candidatus Aerophobetes bacterium]
MVHHNCYTLHRSCKDIYRKTLRRKSGFTFVELIFITGILSISLLALTKIFPYSFEAKHRAESYSQIAVLSQNLIEQIKKDGYELLDKKYPESSPGYGKSSGEFKSYPDFSWQVEWWQTEIPNLRKIKVRVSGKTEKEGHPWELEIVTYLAARR